MLCNYLRFENPLEKNCAIKGAFLEFAAKKYGSLVEECCCCGRLLRQSEQSIHEVDLASLACAFKFDCKA